METASHRALSRLAQTDLTLLILDIHGHIIACHHGHLLFGEQQTRELLGKHYTSIYPAPDSANVLDLALKADLSGEQARFESWMLGKHNRRIRLEISVHVLKKHDEHAHGYAMILRDMHLNRLTHDRLRESERRLRLFMQGAPEHAICMLDPHGSVIDWNLGMRRITGFSAEGIVGHPFSAFFPEAALSTQLLRSAASGSHIKAECELMHASGLRFPAEVEMQPVHEGDGSLIGFAVLIHDCTQQKLMEHRLQEARSQLVHAQKIEAIGRLTGGITHDFNNALQGIISSLELGSLSLDQGGIVQARHHMMASLHTAMHAGRLTQRLLSLLRRHNSPSHLISVSKVLQSMRELLGRTLGDDITLDVSHSDELPLLVCDSDQLESALVNLAVNSRDAMGGHGHMRITCRPCTQDDSDVRVAFGPAHSTYIEIAVADDGPGMSEDVLQRAFEPFFTTKPEGYGTGLGLSMVYDFVAQYNGAVDIRSSPGAGTCVLLYLPCDSAASTETMPLKNASPAPDLHGFHILVAEDNETIRHSIATRLRQLGNEVVEAASGHEALSLLAGGASWDLLLSDIDLPAIDGHELCCQARKQLPELRVILMTGYADSEWLEDNALGDATEALIKPFDMGDLLTKAQSLLQPAD
ncbi:hybrid sensor histidine kinase/response regulator [Dyella nitratireducens]|uniref:histidine kinase n=1 Tax=Dyella nitratireducens TaxID=1849580 RepID=A0ABQ1GFL1_9GAMM|nr:PAS domain-containing sensor histidine kinase [Dyella nitratireducens]GGA42708.1 histidine kinase [Dyella nitratireducens]GLQ41968.1 histidine kinase [Dyella nitratireducens]